jgi:hypothetical protein
MTTINAQELIPFTISPVPSKTLATKLRSFPGIFAYNLNPQFGSPVFMVINFTYLNKWSEAKLI